MDTPEGDVLPGAGALTESVAKGEKGQDILTNRFLSRASSAASLDRLERSSATSSRMVPESYEMLKKQIQSLQNQLSAKSMSFQAVSHTVALLENENGRLEARVKQLEEEAKFSVCSARGAALDDLIQNRIQGLSTAMAEEVEGLQRTMDQNSTAVQSLSKEVRESKKFLWDELEGIQAELRGIHQKLMEQEKDITRNLVSIKKMQEKQTRCNKLRLQPSV